MCKPQTEDAAMKCGQKQKQTKEIDTLLLTRNRTYIIAASSCYLMRHLALRQSLIKHVQAVLLLPGGAI